MLRAEDRANRRNNELRRLEDEQIDYEQALKQMESWEGQLHMMDQQMYYKLEEQRERWHLDSRLLAYFTECQTGAGNAQNCYMHYLDEKDKCLKQKKQGWANQEDDIYQRFREEELRDEPGY